VTCFHGLSPGIQTRFAKPNRVREKAALRAGTIQHLFRDMHAGTQHITSSPPVYASMGRELGGMAKGKKWLFLNLVDQ